MPPAFRPHAATATALLAALLLVATASGSTLTAFVPQGAGKPAASSSPAAASSPPAAPTAAAGGAPSSSSPAGASAAASPLTRMAASASQPKKQPQTANKKRGSAEAGGTSSSSSSQSGKALKMKAPPAGAVRADFGPQAPSSELVGGGWEREAAVAEEEALFHHLGEEHNSALQLRRLRSLGKWPVLVLNADCQPLSFLPLSVLKWQDAVKAVWLDRVTVLEYYPNYIHSSQGPWQLPSVVCLKEYQKARREHVALNRRNIYLRDRYECAFCLTRLRAIDLSLDHVHPRCKGGKSTWENLVTCCRNCNRKKGKRTVKELKEIGMMLMKPPRRPTMTELQGIARQFRTSQGMVHESWQPYLGIKQGEE